MRNPKTVEAALIEREHLTRVLLEQMERTFGAEGSAGALALMEELLLRLDETSLREYAYLRGITSEADLEPDAVESARPTPESG